MPDQVACVSHVQEVCGAEILPGIATWEARVKPVNIGSTRYRPQRRCSRLFILAVPAVIHAVCDLFRGQEVCRTEFHGHSGSGGGGPTRETGFRPERSRRRQPAYASRRRDSRDLKDIQLRNGLPPVRVPGIRRLHRGYGDRNRKDLRLSAYDFRAEQALRLHQVRHRRSVGSGTPFEYFLSSNSGLVNRSIQEQGDPS